MESSPTSPSAKFVNSPRRTLSFVRSRPAKVFLSDPKEEKKGAAGSTSDRGANHSEVYGFVGAITTIVATAIYLVWAYVPESLLHAAGISYFPDKYWALAVPVFFMMAIALMLAFYLGLNFMATPPPTSFDTIFDEHSRERSEFVASPGVDQPIEPISDIGVDCINQIMFGQPI